MKKVIVVARQTIGEIARDRVFHAVLLFSVLFVLFSIFLSTLTIVESRKILLDFGLAAISVMGIVLSVFLGVTVVGREIDRRIIYTVLSKPISRSQYIFGKMLGAGLVVAAIHLLNTLTLVVVLRLLGEEAPAGVWASAYLSILESLLVLGVAFFFSLCLSSVFLSASLTIAVFLIGRSGSSLRLIYERSESGPVKALSWGAHKIFPAFERFNIRELVAYDKPFPREMLGVGAAYFGAYMMFLLAASVLVFRRKDLG